MSTPVRGASGWGDGEATQIVTGLGWRLIMRNRQLVDIETTYPDGPGNPPVLVYHWKILRDMVPPIQHSALLDFFAYDSDNPPPAVGFQSNVTEATYDQMGQYADQEYTREIGYWILGQKPGTHAHTQIYPLPLVNTSGTNAQKHTVNWAGFYSSGSEVGEVTVALRFVSSSGQPGPWSAQRDVQVTF